MSSLSENAKIAEELKREFMNDDTTCLVWNDGVIFEHKSSSVAPIAEFWFAGDLENAVVVDKVIGKASAMFMTDGKAAYIHGKLMSEPAIEFVEKEGVEFSFDEKTPKIINRAGDGLCPMESTIIDTDDPKEGIERILEKMKEFGML